MRNIVYFIIACLILQVNTTSQTIKQKKVINEESWRITKTVSQNKISRNLFGQANSSVQVTFEDKTKNKSILIKFATDQLWNRITYGDFEKWIKSYGSYGNATNKFANPTSIAFMSYDFNGVRRHELFVLDKMNQRIQVLKINFRFSGSGGSGDTDIEYVTSITNQISLKTEDIATYWINGVPYLIASEAINNRILFYDLSTGSYTYKNAYGTTGSGTNQFDGLTSIDITSAFGQTFIFANDYNNKRIVKMGVNRNDNGSVSVTWLSTMLFTGRISSLSTDDFGNLWIADYSTDQIRKYDNNFQAIEAYGDRQTGQLEGKTYNVRNFSTGSYLCKYQNGTFSFYKNDVAFLVEDWTDNTGAAVYDLGTALKGFQVNIPTSGSMAGTTFSYNVTDMSKFYITAEKQVNGVWSFVKSWGFPINNWLTEISFPGTNTIFWDGKDESGNLLPLGVYRFKLQVKEVYNDPDAPVFEDLITYYGKLDAELAGNTCVLSKGHQTTLTANPVLGTGVYEYLWTPGGSKTKSATFSVSSCPTNVSVTIKSGTESITLSTSLTYQNLGCNCGAPVGGCDEEGNPGGSFPCKQLSIIDDSVIPNEFKLFQNYPNPFNPSSTLRFSLPKASNVTLKIFNLNGQEVKLLVGDYLSAGSYSTVWDGTDNSGRKVASGVYIYQLVAGSFVASKRLTFIK